MSVVVIGSCGVDFFTYATKFPKEGETIKGLKFQKDFGGKGANQAVMAARLNADVSMVARVGEEFSDEILNNFQSNKVNTTYVLRTEGVSSGIANIIVEENGENRIIIIPGANNHLTSEDVTNALPAIKNSKVMLTQFEVNLDTTLTALKLGRENGIITLLNPAPAFQIPDTFYPFIDILVPNEGELQLISGMPVTNQDEAVLASKSLIEKGVKSIIVTLGPNGSILVDSDRVLHVPAKEVKVIDTTGAGDCYLGSLGVYLARGEDIKVAMEKASSLATLSVTREGTQKSYPSFGEIQ